MNTKKHASVYDRYLQLHAEWTKNKETADHLAALPSLVLAETIEQCTDRIVVDLGYIRAAMTARPTLPDLP